MNAAQANAATTNAIMARREAARVEIDEAILMATKRGDYFVLVPVAWVTAEAKAALLADNFVLSPEEGRTQVKIDWSLPQP